MKNDNERKGFLEDLKKAKVTITSWETEFLESCLKRTEYSEKQRAVIDKMYSEYGEKV